ncbi:MAG TPA: MFS transporter [Candidatus Methylomirabilis sp.]|nr:MFS transporter [Candidatus Methylomirabilis sp.]
MLKGEQRNPRLVSEPFPASLAAVSTAPATAHWLTWLCLSRLSLSLIFNAYAGVLPLVRQAWGMSAARAATVQSAWQLGYLVSLFIAGMLADRYGARRTYLVASLFAAGAACAFAVFSRGYLSALLLYGLAGLCSGGSYTPGLALVYQLTAAETRGRAMGWFLAASSLGYALALGSQALLSALGSWRAGLLFAAGAAVLGAGFGWIALRGVPKVSANASQGSTPWRGITQTLKDPAAMACNWAYTCHSWELLALWAWLPSFLAAAGQGTLSRAGGSWGIGVAGLAHLLGATGSILGGTASDRLGRPRVMLLFTGLSLTGSFLLGWLWAWPFWLLVLAACCYNVCAIADSSVYSTALAETVPTARLGAAYSVRSVMGFGAGAISPVVFGAVFDIAHGAFPLPSHLDWVLAWSSAGVGALLGPLMIRRFARLAHGRRAAPGDGV